MQELKKNQDSSPPEISTDQPTPKSNTSSSTPKESKTPRTRSRIPRLIKSPTNFHSENTPEMSGKCLNAADVKLTPISKSDDQNKISVKVATAMKQSIQDIIENYQIICENLLSRRSDLIEVIEIVINSDVDKTLIASKMDSLKEEGGILKTSLVAFHEQQESNINDLMDNWEQPMSTKKTELNPETDKEFLERNKDHDKLTSSTNAVITQLQDMLFEQQSRFEKSEENYQDFFNKMQEKNNMVEKLICETNIFLKCNNTRLLRSTITETEAELKHVQDQEETCEIKWNTEKEYFSKILKIQKTALEKLRSEHNDSQIRWNKAEKQYYQSQQVLRESLSTMQDHLKTKNDELKKVVSETFGEIKEKFLIKIGTVKSVDSEKGLIDKDGTSPKIEENKDVVATNMCVQEAEFEDQLKMLEAEIAPYVETLKPDNADLENQKFASYQKALGSIIFKFTQKSIEVMTLKNQLHQLQATIDFIGKVDEKLSNVTKKTDTIQLQEAEVSNVLPTANDRDNKIAFYKASNNLLKFYITSLMRCCNETRNVLEETIFACKLTDAQLRYSLHKYHIITEDYTSLVRRHIILKNEFQNLVDRFQFERITSMKTVAPKAKRKLASETGLKSRIKSSKLFQRFRKIRIFCH